MLLTRWRCLTRWGLLTRWRRARPFGASCLVAAAGVEILLVPVAGVGLVVNSGVGGYAGFLVGVFLIAMGAGLCWGGPRDVIAVLVVMAALVAFVLSNLGGLLLGSLMAIVGAAWGFAWTPPVIRA